MGGHRPSVVVRLIRSHSRAEKVEKVERAERERFCGLSVSVASLEMLKVPSSGPKGSSGPLEDVHVFIHAHMCAAGIMM